MNKQEQFLKMKEFFKSEIGFFKYLGYKNASQHLYSYKKRKDTNKLYSVILDLYEKGYKLKLLINESL